MPALDLDYGIPEAVAEAAAWLRHRAPPPARVRVVGDDDCDGVTGAWSTTTALRRAGWKATPVVRALHEPAHVRAVQRGSWDAMFVIDAGSAFLKELDAAGRPVVVLDHHTAPDVKVRHVHEVNPRRVAGNRTWHVSASTIASLFAVALDPKNGDLAFAGLAGSISDRQHLGGFDGLAGRCLDAAVESGNVRRRKGLTLPGDTLVEAIAESFDPYFRDLAGSPERTAAFVRGLGLDPEADPLQLAPAAARRLAKALDDELARGSNVPERIYPLYEEQLPLEHASGVRSVLALTRLLEAATARDRHQSALALLDGSPRAHRAIARLAHERRTRLLEEIARLKEAVREEPGLRWCETKHPSDTGVYAHALLTYVFGDTKPLAVFARTGRTMKVSTRGSPRLFLAGLDLAVAVAEAAAKVGGSGGGHPGAAGANIPASERDAFLRELQAAFGRATGGP